MDNNIIATEQGVPMDQTKCGPNVIGVEAGVPMPTVRSRNVYPYKTMAVGDSFFVRDGKLQIVCNANWKNGKKLGRKFAARREADGVRVWRVE